MTGTFCETYFHNARDINQSLIYVRTTVSQKSINKANFICDF